MAIMVDTEAGVKVVKTNGGIVRMVLVCAMKSGYSFSSYSAEYVSGAKASVFNKASFARARRAVNSSRVIMRKKSESLGLCRLLREYIGQIYS